MNSMLLLVLGIESRTYHSSSIEFTEFVTVTKNKSPSNICRSENICNHRMSLLNSERFAKETERVATVA
ncbi:hypothetical protein J6590_028914 [Homalodisca vitripennis]|nr:hypothetical protein J6590_028914 [Homalodisca vitripennis]